MVARRDNAIGIAAERIMAKRMSAHTLASARGAS
jgi:hypothetical protein